MGEGFHLCHIHIAVQVDGLGLLGKHHGNAEFLGDEGRNADTGSFDGHNLGDGLVTEAALEFPADLFHQRNVHLVVQKAVHLQHITGLDDAVLHNSLF